jgi:calpain-5
MACGLVKGHAYSVNAVKKIRLGKSLISVINRAKIRMVRCRNPCGGTEWKGAWSDGQELINFLLQ